MRSRSISATAALALLLVIAPTAGGQQPAAGAQAPILPRTSDGKPNLSGIWQALNTAAWDIQDHSAREGIPAGQGVVEGNDIPYQPWAAARRRENFANRSTTDPEKKCFLPGVPRATYMPFPFQIIHTPQQVTFLYEYAHTTRIVYTNGTRHPEGAFEFWMGDSRGRWEGDTLVVDVAHQHPDTWLDRAGNFHSEALHVVERYTLVGPDHLNYDVTIEDVKVFTRPWKMSMPLYRRKDRNIQLLDFECQTFKVYPEP